MPPVPKWPPLSLCSSQSEILKEGTASGQAVPSPSLQEHLPSPRSALRTSVSFCCQPVDYSGLNHDFGPQGQGIGFIQKEQAENKPQRVFPRSNHGVNSRCRCLGLPSFSPWTLSRCQGKHLQLWFLQPQGSSLDLQVQSSPAYLILSFYCLFRCALPSSIKDAKEPL